MRLPQRLLINLAILAPLVFFHCGAAVADPYFLSTFSVDVTIPIGHRCMGILEQKAVRISDPLLARGVVLQGLEQPIVLVAVDWCEIRNDAYERWRHVLAEAAGTSRERVLVASVHQHDAPVVDLGAEALLADVGLPGELCDTAFHEGALQGVAQALRESLTNRQPVTHIGMGRARVDRIASNRRVLDAQGHARFDRGSSSGGDPSLADAPEGLVDPWLATLSFWNRDKPLAALHAYATHPMSHYGRGEVSADFVGMARRQMQQAHPETLQIYFSGCAGDVTAGKYNDGDAANRPLLAQRLYEAMQRAWRDCQRRPLRQAELRVAKLALDFNEAETLAPEALQRVLHDDVAKTTDRVYAAMGLASRHRADRPIDFPCLDFGDAQVVLFPGEAFVGYQLLAQRMRNDAFVLSIGYGECWPGYLPTQDALDEGFGDTWRWAGSAAPAALQTALWKTVCSTTEPTAAGETIVNDVWIASESHPRFSEGSIVVLRDGSLLYAATEFVDSGSDFAKASIVARTSLDGGRTWGPRRLLQQNIGQMNVMSVSLKRIMTADQSGIAMFYLVKNGHDDLDVQMRLSTDEAATFGESVVVTDRPGYHVMNNDRVVQLLDGRLLCPVAWTRDVVQENHFTAFCYLSDNGGRTWRAGKGRVDAPRRGAMEPEVIELKQGRLLMILRTQFSQIYASYSNDRGDTWSEPAPWGVESPESPATLRRIPSTGDLLLVWNPTYREGADHGGQRTPLAAALSCDEGQRWRPHRIIEDRDDQTYAYTSLTFSGDRALLSYYVGDNESKRISSRFRSVPIGWFYREE